MTNEPSQEWMDRAVDYVRGELEVDEQLRFEAELAADPALASELEALFATDALLERELGNARAAPRRRLRLLPWLAAAAAVLLLSLAGRLLLLEVRPDVRVAVLAGTATPEEFLAAREDLRGLRPPWADQARAPGEEPNVGAEEFVARAVGADVEAAAAAPQVIESGLFLVRISNAASRAVVIAALPRAGDPRRLFPVEGASPVLPAGASTLPRPRFSLGASGAVEHERGFVVPLEAGALELWVASGPPAAAAGLVAAVDRALAAGDPGQALAELFDELGFDVERRRVREPTDG